MDRDAYIRGLLEERHRYEQIERPDRAAEVDAELARLGVKADTSRDVPRPPHNTQAPKPPANTAAKRPPSDTAAKKPPTRRGRGKS